MIKPDFTVVSSEEIDGTVLVRISKDVLREIGYAAENIISELNDETYTEAVLNEVLQGGDTDNDELKSVAIASMVLEQVKRIDGVM